MTTTQQLISPTEVSFYADHASDTLRKIVAEKTDASLFMALNGGEAVAQDAMRIANAAWGQLVLRGEA